MYVWKEKWNHFLCEWKKRKRNINTLSNFTQRKQREQGRLHKNNKEGQDPFSLCEDEEEEDYKERESIKRRMERVINISETAKREVNREINHLSSQGVTVTDSFLIKDKESRRTESICKPRGRTVILDLTTRTKWLRGRILFSLLTPPHTESSLAWRKDGQSFCELLRVQTGE